MPDDVGDMDGQNAGMDGAAEALDNVYGTDIRGIVRLTETLTDGEREAFANLEGIARFAAFRRYPEPRNPQDAWPTAEAVPDETIPGAESCGLFDHSVARDFGRPRFYNVGLLTIDGAERHEANTMSFPKATA